MWMHQKSVAGRWQIYLKEKLSNALNQRTAWFLFSLAFIAVYREVFETVLFFAALWTNGNGLPLLVGLAAGFVALGAIAWVLLRTSARLPIGKFFAPWDLSVLVDRKRPTRGSGCGTHWIRHEPAAPARALKLRMPAYFR